MTSIHKPNRCCTSYDNLLPVSIRTETGEWKTMWQCQVCGEYYDVTLESVREHTYSHVRITRMERIDRPAYALHHKALDTVQFRLMQEGVDIFSVEREMARLNVTPREGMCDNCLIDPVMVRTAEGKETYTCRWCGTTFQVKTLSTDKPHETPFAVFTSETKTPSEPTILSSEESYTETKAAAGVSPTPDTLDPLSTGEDTMPRYSDTDALMNELFTDRDAIIPATSPMDQKDFNHLVDTFLPTDDTDTTSQKPVLDIPDHDAAADDTTPSTPTVAATRDVWTALIAEEQTDDTSHTDDDVCVRSVPSEALLPETKMFLAAEVRDATPRSKEDTATVSRTTVKPMMRVTATIDSVSSRVYYGEFPVTNTTNVTMTIDCAAFTYLGKRVSGTALDTTCIYPLCAKQQPAEVVQCSFTSHPGGKPTILPFWCDTQFSVEIIDQE